MDVTCHYVREKDISFLLNHFLVSSHVVSLGLTAKVASEGNMNGIGMYPVSVQETRQTDLIREEAKIQIHRQSPKNTGCTAYGG